jgi:hypothetical protein
MARVSHTVLTAMPAGEGIALRRLANRTGLRHAQIVMAMDRLSKRGLVVHTALGKYLRTPAGDAFIAAGAEVKPGPSAGGNRPLRSDDAAGRDTLRDRAWSALRQLKKATIPELIELAGKGTEADATSNLRRYLWKLATYEIVAKLKRRVPGLAPTSNGFVQFVLVRDLGPKAPLWRSSTRHLIDRNSDTIVALPEAAP